MFIHRRHKALKFGGRGRERSCYSMCSKGTLLATFADPFSSTIYNHSSIARCAATTKILHLLYEEVLLKTRKWCMILFTINDLFIMNMMGMGEKNPKYIQTKNKEKFPVWLLSHPPIYKIRGRLFSGAKEPKTSRTYPRWDGNPNLQG